MARKTLPPEQRQTELMDAAVELFRVQGIENTSVSDIVKRAGVAQGTFYWYYKSKEELINKIVQVLTGQILRDIIRLIDSPEHTALEKTEGIKELLLKMLSHRSTLERFHHHENSQFHDQLSREVIRQLTPAVTRLIEQGMEEGVFKVPHPDQAAAFILGACMGVPQDPSMFINHDQLLQWLNSLFAFILRGLGNFQ